MKKLLGRLILVFIICIVGVSAASVGVFYYNYISQRIYEDSTVHLEEIYSQVNNSFGIFLDKNWSVLDSWGNYFAAAQGNDNVDISAFIAEEQKSWGFSDFYFIASDGRCVTLNGVEDTMASNDMLPELIQNKEHIMTGKTLSSGQEVIVFAAPVQHGRYKDFDFDAIAVCYNNADLASSLNVEAFSGNAKCFVIHNDGSILLSTQTGGNVFENYLMYLKAASDIGDKELNDIRSEWESGKSGILQCKIGDVDYCILYQPVGYQDYILLSAVPLNVVSAGFLSVQKTTTNVVIIISLLIGIAVITLLLMRGHRLSRINRMELLYREKMFDLLSNNVDDIFIMLDAEDHSVDYISPNIERLIGISAQETRENIRALLKASADKDIIIPREVLEDIPVQGNRFWEYEYVHQTTGERRWYRMTVYHMELQGVKKYIIVLSDRTMDRQMTQKLQEALTAARSANEAKSNFLSNMSHDIRTPMNAIVGFSVLLEKDADRPDKVREYTRKITASSHHLLSLINDVLDMSKIESGKTSLNVEVFSLPELLEELSIILMPQAKAKKQEFKIQVQGKPPEQLTGDKLRLNQILINLLSNAIKYTPDGGKIEFTVSEISHKRNQYTKLRFIVKDNGIGMSEEFQKQVFQPFSREISSVTNKVQGTGLGMAITKNLVDLMGGIIQVESQTGKGTTFTVELTFSVSEQNKNAELWYHQRVKRILVADDEEEICMDICELMRDTGVEVACASDGKTAVAMAVEAHKQNKDFDVILLDWKMPGVDGIQTAGMLRKELGEGVPILVLTSYDWDDIEDEARRAGINAFMPKPFFVSTFWQVIKPLFLEYTEHNIAADENIMQGLHFLVAEDNELNAEIFKEMLAIDGAGCDLAVNGQEALDKFEASAPGCYDLIFMDVQMPVMNGYDATKKIRLSSHPEAKTIPVVAMTANTFAEDVRNAFDAGMNGHLAKPIDMEAVRTLVAQLVGRRSEGGKG